ncbi:MAG: glycosyltransferase family 39 protein [Terracidiphilus sp.]
MTRLDWIALKKWDPRRRRVFLENAFVASLVAGAFLVRIWGMSRMHFWDENVYLLNAGFLGWGKANYTEIGSRPPLLSILFAGVFHLWHSDYAAWIVTASLNAFGPAFLYLAGRRIVGEISAALAALLLAFSPFFAGVLPDGNGGFVPNTSGHSLLTDSPALTLILLSLWLLLRALEKQTDFRFALAGLGFALAVLMRFGSLSSVGMLSFLVLAANRRVRAALACGAGFGLGMVPYLCWSRLRYGGFLATFRAGWSYFTGPSESFFFYVKSFVVIFSWLALAGLALWFIRRVWELVAPRENMSLMIKRCLGQNQRRWEAFLLFWALAVMLFFSSLSHKELRYCMPVAPPLFLLAGVGLSTLLEGRRPLTRFAGSALLAAALLSCFWPTRHRFDTSFIDHSESEEMTVSDFLKQNLPSTTVLYTNRNYPDFEYYAEMQVRPLPETGPSLYEKLNQLPSDGILIAYRPDDPDDPNPAIEPPLAWLDANPHFHRFHEFPPMVLYQYHSVLPTVGQPIR